MTAARDQLTWLANMRRRILDKPLEPHGGKLPDGYHLGVIPGSRTFDDRICHLLQVDFEALRAGTR